VTRTDFQNLAQLRLDEAQCLLSAGHFCGAYYVAGYVIECALKACIAKQTQAGDFPPAANLKDSHFTHELTKLLKTANLEGNLRTQSQAVQDNWRLLSGAPGGSENRRYETNISQVEANDCLNAINDANDRVLIWLKNHW
jgi:HEPN domain-containing protein